MQNLVRFAHSNKEAKLFLQGAKDLKAYQVKVRAHGLWLGERNEIYDLTKHNVSVRSIKSIWIEARINGAWVKVRANADPTLDKDQLPKLEISIDFN